MENIPDLASIKAAAKRNKVTMGQIFTRAGVSPSTVYRWRDGNDPKISTVRRLQAALDELSAK